MSDNKQEIKMKCFICGQRMKVYSRENYKPTELGDFAFSSRKIPEYMHYELYECKVCKVLVANNPPSSEKLAEEYERADFDSGNEARNASKTYIRYLKKYIPNFSKGRSLDIGTGEGSYLKYLKDEGVREIVGVEPSQAPIDAADSTIRPNIIKDVFSAERFEKESFDMISCFQTIEHIPDSRKLLQDIYALLKDRGLVYIVCHNYCSLVNKILGTKSPIYDIEHLQLFSKRSIYRLLKECGYSNIKTFSIWNRYPIRYWLRLFPFPKGMKRAILKSAESHTWGNIELAINVGNVGVIAHK